MIDERKSLAVRIQQAMEEKGCYLLTRPAEMAQFETLEDAIRFAEEHHWMLVPHLGGEQYEFIESSGSPEQQIF